MHRKAGFVIISQAGRVCPYCNRAKETLGNRDIAYEAKELSGDELRLAASAAGMNTVPIIYHGKYRIGGYSDLLQYLLDNVD